MCAFNKLYLYEILPLGEARRRVYVSSLYYFATLFESNSLNIDDSNNNNNINNNFETHVYVCISVPIYIYTNSISDLTSYLRMGIGSTHRGYATKYSVALSRAHHTLHLKKKNTF